MEEKGSFVRISSLLWADILVGYAFFVMQNYLTDVWGLSFTHSAAILNFWGGICMFLPGFCLYIVDEWLGHFGMLVLSSIAYSVGIAFVAMSGPPVLANATGTCKQYESECIGSTQKALFYTGMVLIAVGMSGNKVSVIPFFNKQKEEANGDGNEETELKAKGGVTQILGYVVIVVVAVTGAIALPYIKPWTIRFAIPAICTASGMFLFLSGSCTYDKSRDVTESPVTNVFRVFVASASKMCKKFPLDAQYYKQGDKIPETFRATRCLRCLEKAAIDPNPRDPVRNKWKVCTVTEVEEAKIAVRMIPMWMTFIICGIVSSIGNTYFVEQASHMDRKIGKWNVPTQMLLLFSQGAGSVFNAFADSFLCKTEEEPIPGSTQTNKIKIPRVGKRPAVGMGLAMIFSILCCITAARIEEKRLGVIRRHDLLEKPEDDIPMSIYWLLFQFFLLAGLDSFLKKSLVAFYAYQAPDSMKAYLQHFTSGVYGLGFMSSVLSVYVVGRISERGGSTNWFQDTLSKSRLDKYYWVLAGMCAVNFLVFVMVAMFYRYKEYKPTKDVELAEIEGPQETGEDPPEGGCSCF